MKNAKHISLCIALLAGSLMAADQADRKCVQREEPEYPQIAARMQLHGTVKLKAFINPDGSVRRVEYIGGHPLLAESAVTSVKTWKYEPASKETNQIVEVKF